MGEIGQKNMEIIRFRHSIIESSEQDKFVFEIMFLTVSLLETLSMKLLTPNVKKHDIDCKKTPKDVFYRRHVTKECHYKKTTQEKSTSHQWLTRFLIIAVSTIPSLSPSDGISAVDVSAVLDIME